MEQVGGSGAPKDYSDWNTRDANKFGDYGGRKGGKPVRKPYLAYLFMVDMDVGHAFSCSFSPAPRATVYEDGCDGASSDHKCPPRKMRKKTGDSVTDLGHSICESVTESMGKMTSRLFRMIEQQDGNNHHPTTHPVNSRLSISETSQNVNEMNRLMDLMERLDKEKIRLENLSGSDGSKERRLRLNALSMERASEMLDFIVSSGKEEEIHTNHRQDFGDDEQLE